MTIWEHETDKVLVSASYLKWLEAVAEAADKVVAQELDSTAIYVSALAFHDLSGALQSTPLHSEANP